MELKRYRYSTKYQNFATSLLEQEPMMTTDNVCEFEEINKHEADAYEKEIVANNKKHEITMICLLSGCVLFLISVLLMCFFKKEVANRVPAIVIISLMSWPFIAMLKKSLTEYKKKEFEKLAYGKVVEIYNDQLYLKKAKKEKRVIATVYFPEDKKYVKNIDFQQQIRRREDIKRTVVVYKMRGMVIASMLE